MKDRTKYFNDFFYFSTLLIIFGVLTYAFLGHLGSALIDCGREAYIPEQIIEGKVLYRDIFVLYGPLSYQLNALLYTIFGIHLNTLYFAGITNSFLILILYYLIARRLTSAKISWLACFLLMTSCMFYYYITNYIFPYSYGVTYALSALLISVFFCAYYLEKAKPVFLILSALFMGACAAFKLDFIVFFAVLFLIAVYFKPLSRKNLIIFIASFLLIPVISWGTVFIRGLSLADLLYYLGMMNDFINSHLFKYFYQEHTGLYPTPKFLWGLSKTAGIYIFNFSICIATFYAFFLASAKFSDFRGKLFLQITGFIALYMLFPKEFFKEIGKTTSLGWIAVGTVIILSVFLAHTLLNKNMTFRKLPEISAKDKIFILVAVAGIISAFKSFFFINLHVFGTYFVPLLILVNLVFLFDKIPAYLKFLNSKAWKNACFAVLFIIGLVYMFTSLNYAYKTNNYLLETDKGRIYVVKQWGTALNKLTNYIKAEIPAESSFMMMPEGLMINFLTDRKGNSWFYSLTPNFVEAFENKIIRDMQVKKPDYIFITNQNTNDYGFRSFGEDYGKSIYNYVKDNYEFVQKIKDPCPDENALHIKIYKLKNSNC